MTNNIIPISRPQRPKTHLRIIGEMAPTGTRPFLGTASDGLQYWCKRFESDHGWESVINEIVASIVGERLGAHVRPWKILHVPESLQGMLVGEGTHRYRLTGMPLFGSQNLDFCTIQQDFSAIPHVRDDENYTHIPKLVALWLLCNPQEDLQILVHHADGNSLWSIDHGLWFDSFEQPWQLSPTDRFTGRPRIPAIRENIPFDRWDRAIYAVQLLGGGLKQDVAEVLPPEWDVPSNKTDKLIDYVLQRKPYTIDTLRAFRDGRR